jgi:hypothetical protein
MSQNRKKGCRIHQDTHKGQNATLAGNVTMSQFTGKMGHKILKGKI